MSIEVDWFLRAHPEIHTIEALLPDYNGVMRGKWIPRNNLPKIFAGEMKLPKGTISMDIWGRDLEELVFVTGDADAVCRPIEGSLLPVPWSPEGGHGQVMMSMYQTSGEPYMADPRHVLKRVVSRFRDRGWRPVMAAELEFSLVTFDAEQPAHTCVAPVGQSPLGGNAYSVDALGRHPALMNDLRIACELQDLPYDGIVKESGPSQYEINLHHVDKPVLAAKQILMMKRLIKGVAAKHGLVASFMAKPFPDDAGNGMHVHCSVVDEQGNNVFDDGSDEGSALLQQAVAGCLRYMPDAMAVLAPNYNSFRRFQKGSLAPTHPCWGYDNRTVAVRIPHSDPAARRLEHRVAGADTNPYLLFAVILGAMLAGIEEQLSPGAPLTGDGYSQAGQPLPVHLPDALRLFRDSAFIRQALGEEMQRNYTLTREQEIDEFRRRITRFEYLTYLEQL